MYHVKCIQNSQSEGDGIRSEQFYDFVVDFLLHYRPGQLCSHEIALYVSKDFSNYLVGLYSPLSQAAGNGLLPVVERLLEGEVDNKSLNEALASACGSPYPTNTRIVELLLLKGADVRSIINKPGWSTLHWAAMYGAIDVMKLLLSYQHNPILLRTTDSTPASERTEICQLDNSIVAIRPMDTMDDESSSIRYVTSLKIDSSDEQGKVTAVQHEASFTNCLDNQGNPPIFLAVEYDRLNAVRFLLENGADVQGKYTENGVTILHQIAKKGNENILQALFEFGCIDNIDPRDVEEATPLYWASQYGHDAIVLWLLKHNADITAKNERKRSAIWVASQEGHIKVVRTLLESGSSINECDAAGFTPLHAASYFGHKEVVSCLLRMEASVTARSADGRTALHLASAAGQISTAERLLLLGAPIDSKDINGRTPLHEALGRGHRDMSKMILERGAAHDVFDQFGRGTMHLASLYGDYELLEILVNSISISNMTALDIQGQNCLHFAAAGGCLQNVEFLLSKGLQVVPDFSGWTPSMIATSRGFSTMNNRLAMVEERFDSSHPRTPQHPSHWNVPDGSLLKCDADGRTLSLNLSGKSPLSREANHTLLGLMTETIELEINPVFRKRAGVWSIINRAGVASARANNCCTSTELGYFEVEILESVGRPGEYVVTFYLIPHEYLIAIHRGVAVGFVLPESPLSPIEFPGWENYSIAYHSDDGCLYSNNIHSNYGETCSQGDVIGCGIDFETHHVYFTKNGDWLGKLPSQFTNSGLLD